VKRGFLVGAKRAGGTDTVLLFGEAGTHMGSEFLRSWVSSCGFSLDVVGPDGPRTLQRGYIASTALANHWFRFDTKDGVLQVNPSGLCHWNSMPRRWETYCCPARSSNGRLVPQGICKAETDDPFGCCIAGENKFLGCGTRENHEILSGLRCPVKPGAKFCAWCGRPL